MLTLPKVARPLVMADEIFLKTYMDAGAPAVKELIEQWRNVNYFDTKKLRKKWQYHVITALNKAVRGTS